MKAFINRVAPSHVFVCSAGFSPPHLCFLLFAFNFVDSRRRRQQPPVSALPRLSLPCPPSRSFFYLLLFLIAQAREERKPPPSLRARKKGKKQGKCCCWKTHGRGARNDETARTAQPALGPGDLSPPPQTPKGQPRSRRGGVHAAWGQDADQESTKYRVQAQRKRPKAFRPQCKRRETILRG